MSRRAMWKGVLRIGTLPVPVKLYAAVEDTDVHFHLLEDQNGERVEQRLVHPETGDAVPKEQVHKGYALEPGVFVMLDAEEIAKLAPPASRDVEIQAFVPDTAIDAVWFERPYHLGPDGDAAAYQALARALESEHRQGIAHWVMRGKVYTAALRAADGVLSLIVLRDREEVLAAPKLKTKEKRAPTKQELALAEQLVESLASELDLTQFHNEHREQVRKLVEQKARGKSLKLVHPKMRKATDDALLTALRSSVKHARAHARGKERKSA